MRPGESSSQVLRRPRSTGPPACALGNRKQAGTVTVLTAAPLTAAEGRQAGCLSTDAQLSTCGALLHRGTDRVTETRSTPGHMDEP